MDDNFSYWKEIYKAFIDKLLLLIVLALIGYFVQQSIPSIEAEISAKKEFKRAQAASLIEFFEIIAKFELEKGKTVLVINNLLYANEEGVEINPVIASEVITQMMAVDKLTPELNASLGKLTILLDQETIKILLPLVKLYDNEKRTADYEKVRKRIVQLIKKYQQNGTLTMNDKNSIYSTILKIRSFYKNNEAQDAAYQKVVLEAREALRTLY